MSNYENELFNYKLKDLFINAMVAKRKSYVQAYESLFSISTNVEELYGKDLYEFTSENLLVLFKNSSKYLKYTTVLSYNSLVKNYKEWVKKNIKNAHVVDGTCSAEQLKTITNFKNYVIFNDREMDEITIDATFDGADYNALIFIRLFWETDGQETASDLCAINIKDFDYLNKTIKVYSTKKRTCKKYEISEWLTEMIYEFAETDRLVFFGRQGTYPIGTAESNNGYIFRMSKSKKTNPDTLGKPMTAIKMSNVLNNYCTQNLTEVITVNDLLMSLALRHMVYMGKTPSDMIVEKRYFKNLPVYVYEDVFNTYAELKYEAINKAI
jgi:hypothetical protein